MPMGYMPQPMQTCQGQYQQPMYGSQMPQYQGNVGTEPMMGYGMPTAQVKPMPFGY